MADASTDLSLIARLLEAASDKGEIAVDGVDSLQVRLTGFPLNTTLPVLEDSRLAGAAVELEIWSRDSRALLRARTDGWSVDEDDEYTPLFPEQKLRYGREEIQSRVTTGNAFCTFDKQGWPKPWTGWSIQSFRAWFEASGAFSAGEILLKNGPGEIRLYNWSGEPVHVPFLTFGNLTFVADSEMTPTWPLAGPGWLLRSALTSGEQAPNEMRELMNYLSYAAALRLIAEDCVFEPSGEWRIVLDRKSGRDVLLSANGRCSVGVADSVHHILYWILSQPVRSRLLVARRVLAEEWIDLTAPMDKDAWQTKAEVTYSAAVDEQVSAALSAQASFENHVLDFSNKSREAGRSLDKTIDDIVTRASTALLALFITSVVAKDIRGWPVIAAAVGVASYMALSGAVALTGLWTDVRLLGQLLTESIVGRPLATISRAEATARMQTHSLRVRIVWRAIILSVLVALVVAVGLALFSFVEQSDSTSPAITPASTVTPTPTT